MNKQDGGVEAFQVNGKVNSSPVSGFRESRQSECSSVEVRSSYKYLFAGRTHAVEHGDGR